MEIQENNHSRKVRRILNSKIGFIPALDWNLTGWLPTSENNVQFILRKNGFHGVVAVRLIEKHPNSFLVGFVDFRSNEPTTNLIQQNDLFDFIEKLVSGSYGYRAPKCSVQPNDPTAQVSF